MGFFFYIGVIVLLFISYMAYNIFQILDINRELSLKNADKCRLKKGVIGAEDIIKFGPFLITPSDDKMKLWENPNYLFSKTPNGGIYLINPQTENFRKLELHGFPSELAFHPHGMYVTENQLLYVINHAYSKGGERVDVFEANPNFGIYNFDTFQLRYKYSIKFDDIHNGRLNSLVVLQTGENIDEFYITSYLPFADPIEGRRTDVISILKNMSIMALKLKWSHLYYCKGVQLNGLANCKQITSDEASSAMNNGITYNPNTKLLYVARTSERKGVIFKFDENDRSILHYQGEVQLELRPDNFHYDNDTNKIIVGGFGKVADHFAFVEYAKKEERHPKPKYLSGAEIINVETNVSEVAVTQNEINGVASAAQVGSKIFMGSWADDGFVVCDI